jgi:hypothetical protein
VSGLDQDTSLIGTTARRTTRSPASATPAASTRVDVDDGTTSVDGTLNIPGTPPVNPALGVTAVAYTNNDANPCTATTLFDIDTTNDNVVVQAPANAGSLSPTGKLGVDATSPVGFDIYSQLGYGTPVGVRALATFNAPDGSRPCTASTCSPAVSLPWARSESNVVDLAIPTDQR